jgi:elongator complex protein 1
VESGKRVIRVYSPSPSPLALQSTSETTLGLEHPLAWNSTGSLIASSQRFGPSLAHGKEGRHDIIFFERNGLRRGGFTLVSSADSKTDRGYQIREVAWSCDSSVLSVWIQFKDGKDVVQLWTIGNYHWYLKHQIEEPSGERFTSVRWHPEEPLRIQLATASTCLYLYE